MTRERCQFGDQRACGTCEADIEWHGRGTGWIDRGSITYCDTSGQGWRDENGVTHRYPHRKHRPGSIFQLPPGARRIR
jgi:hypothetical protein